jgi:hypothetical protein
MNFISGIAGFLITLTPLVLLTLLIVNKYKDTTKFAGYILIVLGVARLLPILLQFRSIFSLFNLDLIPMITGLINKLTSILFGVLLILGGLSIRKKEKKRSIVFISSLGIYISIVPLALAVILGNAPILQTLIPILTFVGIAQTPVAIYDHDNCVLITEGNTKIVILVAVVILGIILVSGLLSDNGFDGVGGSSGRTCAQPGCSRSAVSSGDSVYCSSHSNRCGNCGCYIDADAMFCMDCLRDALS